MTNAQLKSMVDAILAHLRGEKVQNRRCYELVDSKDGQWLDAPDPNFNTPGLEWRVKPKEPMIRYAILGEIGIWSDRKIAESYAKDLDKDLITLTETSRESFAKKPLRFWGLVDIYGHVHHQNNKEFAESTAETRGGFAAEFQEIVK